MRFPCVLALLALAGCARGVIPGTRVPDDPQNRAILDVVARYKQAMEARDAEGLLTLAAPGYFDKGDPNRPRDPRNLDGLRKQLPRDFADVKALKLDIDVRKVNVDGDNAQVDYFGVLRYAVQVQGGEKWFSEADDARLSLVKVDGAWKISSGM